MSTPPAEMICPKCHGQMTSYERQSITIDQCTDCRGIFLDRGELERLIDAEAAYTPTRATPERGDERYRKQRRDYDNDDEDYRGHDKRRRSGGFLGDLFG